MGALDKFKNLFGEKGPTPKAKKKPETLKEVKADQKSSQNAVNKTREKAEVEILQKKIQEKLRKDPQLQKKAAMILENMINKGPSKK